LAGTAHPRALTSDPRGLSQERVKWTPEIGPNVKV
jgi:hypothetical protein